MSLQDQQNMLINIIKTETNCPEYLFIAKTNIHFSYELCFAHHFLRPLALSFKALELDRGDGRAEAQIMRQLRHPHIMRFRDSFEEKVTGWGVAMGEKGGKWKKHGFRNGLA